MFSNISLLNKTINETKLHKPSMLAETSHNGWSSNRKKAQMKAKAQNFVSSIWLSSK